MTAAVQAPPAEVASALGPAYALDAAEAARRAQLAVRAGLMRDVIRLWPALDPRRLDETFRGWAAAMSQLVTGYRRQSATAGATFYRAARSAALQSPTPASLIRVAPDLPADLLQRAFGFSGPGMLTREVVQPGAALSTTLGTASRIALDGGRLTVTDTAKSDPAAVGWYRVTDGHPCAWCAMLASRGITYRSQRTAGFHAHNACGCVAAPAFSRKQRLPGISDRAEAVWRESTGGLSGKEALTAFRKAWGEHTPEGTRSATTTPARPKPAPKPAGRTPAQIHAELTALEGRLSAATPQQHAWMTQRIATLRTQLGQ